MSIGSAAMAEPSVTLYGILDGGVSVSKLQHQSAKVQMTNGNWLSNRWGLMGQEDLGGGNSVFFKLEQPKCRIKVTSDFYGVTFS